MDAVATSAAPTPSSALVPKPITSCPPPCSTPSSGVAVVATGVRGTGLASSGQHLISGTVRPLRPYSTSPRFSQQVAARTSMSGFCCAKMAAYFSAWSFTSERAFVRATCAVCPVSCTCMQGPGKGTLWWLRQMKQMHWQYTWLFGQVVHACAT